MASTSMGPIYELETLNGHILSLAPKNLESEGILVFATESFLVDEGESSEEIIDSYTLTTIEGYDVYIKPHFHEDKPIWTQVYTNYSTTPFVESQETTLTLLSTNEESIYITFKWLWGTHDSISISTQPPPNTIIVKQNQDKPNLPRHADTSLPNTFMESKAAPDAIKSSGPRAPFSDNMKKFESSVSNEDSETETKPNIISAQSLQTQSTTISRSSTHSHLQPANIPKKTVHPPIQGALTDSTVNTNLDPSQLNPLPNPNAGGNDTLSVDFEQINSLGMSELSEMGIDSMDQGTAIALSNDDLLRYDDPKNQPSLNTPPTASATTTSTNSQVQNTIENNSTGSGSGGFKLKINKDSDKMKGLMQKGMAFMKQQKAMATGAPPEDAASVDKSLEDEAQRATQEALSFIERILAANTLEAIKQKSKWSYITLPISVLGLIGLIYNLIKLYVVIFIKSWKWGIAQVLFPLAFVGFGIKQWVVIKKPLRDSLNYIPMIPIGLAPFLLYGVF